MVSKLPANIMASCPAEYKLHVSQVPLTFREVGIRTGYRKPRCSLTQCVKSAFWPTNETLNFWTHFFPFWYFVAKFCDFYDNDAFRRDAYHWPFMAYLATVCAWPIVSCFAHLFSVMSEEVRHVCFFVDYVSLSWYSFGAAAVYHAYAFDDVFFNTCFSGTYLYAAAISAVVCTFFACQSRFITSPHLKKILRVVSFVLPFAVVSVPLGERLIRRMILINFNMDYDGSGEPAMSHHLRQFFWAGLGIVFYGFHIPESVLPGYFDYVGHSHQLLHICGIMATYHQMWACYTDMISRQELLRDRHALPAGGLDLALVIVVLIANLIILLVYSARVYRQRKKDGAEKKCE